MRKKEVVERDVERDRDREGERKRERKRNRKEREREREREKEKEEEEREERGRKRKRVEKNILTISCVDASLLSLKALFFPAIFLAGSPCLISSNLLQEMEIILRKIISEEDSSYD